MVVHPAEAYVAGKTRQEHKRNLLLGLDRRGPPLPPSPSHRPQETRGEDRCDGEGGRGYRKAIFMRLEIPIIKRVTKTYASAG